MHSQDIKSCLKAIELSWNQLESKQEVDGHSAIKLPYPYISPSVGIFHSDQFYWDSYFIVVGLLASGKTELARGMVDNLLFMGQEYGFVPMRNRQYDTGISQPPFLSSMVKDIYAATRDRSWLEHALPTVEHELNNYWRNTDKTDHISDHEVYRGLSRYADHHLIDQTAEHESGWDMTSRFDNAALQFLPVDLNSLLHKYEIDLAEIYHTLGNNQQARHYQAEASSRQKTLSALMWNETSGFFYDYNYELRKRSHFHSLAGYFPMWSGAATSDQADKMVQMLPQFEYAGGLATSQKEDLITPFRQWDYPNGWAPLHWIVINGLLEFGFNQDAERIARKWIELNTEVFKETGRFWEKYDVVNQTVGRSGRYPTQSGFGWTNAIYVALVKKFNF